MKNLPYLLLFILFSACTHPSIKEKSIAKTTDTVQKDTIVPGDKDSVLMDDNDHKATKGELRKILKENPELNDTEFPQSPDIIYYGRSNESTRDYGSEVGRDNYYVLYAYFLKLKNGEKKYHQQRETLIKIYNDINFIHQKIKGGGTYFIHQYPRILGYAEYSIWKGKDHDDYTREYDITKQKDLYIKALRQIIDDELNVDFDYPEKEKTKLKKELSEATGEINKLISNYFYLKMAQEFQYSNY